MPLLLLFIFIITSGKSYTVIKIATPIEETSQLVTNDHILPKFSWDYTSFLGSCAPSLSLKTLVFSRNQAAISKYAPDLFSRMTKAKRESLPASVLLAVATEFEKRKDWKSLFEISDYDQLTVLKVLFASNNANAISAYLNANIRSMNTKDKQFILENLIVSYKLELLDLNIQRLLKEGLDSTDLEGLEELEELIETHQCKICMEKSISKYFSCISAQKYNHGACIDCFKYVQSSQNAACPWCREPNKK